MTLTTNWAMSLWPQSVRVCPILPSWRLWNPLITLSCPKGATVSPNTQASVLILVPSHHPPSPPNQHPFAPLFLPLPLMKASHTARATLPTWSLCSTRTFLQRMANRHRGPCISVAPQSEENLLHVSVYSLVVLFFRFETLTTAYGQAIGSVCVLAFWVCKATVPPALNPLCTFSRSLREKMDMFYGLINVQHTLY